MKKKILIILLTCVILIFLSFILIFIFYKPAPLIARYFLHKVGLSGLICVGPGQIFENASLGPDGNFGKCCAGLVSISKGFEYAPTDAMANSNGCVPLFGGGNICSECGNGICEEWENQCNCQKDCK